MNVVRFTSVDFLLKYYEIRDLLPLVTPYAVYIHADRWNVLEPSGTSLIAMLLHELTD